MKMLTNSDCSRWPPERGGRASCELLSVSSSLVAILLMRTQVRSFSYKVFVKVGTVSSIQTLKDMGVRPKKAYYTIVVSKKLIARLLHTI